ncbi:GDCCVxC domain-containing (seleno)protein [uncultured Amphritea sp.]|uniref:GDCCVxC domain-containing (seleno)protein n=1 Tax=uncultured Amphritea sp. TaxID=981605 RepID=UPI003429EEC7
MTCPSCGKQDIRAMPLNSLEHLFTCKHCGVNHSEKPGSCCVFCSYGIEKCPTIQDIIYRLADQNH